MKCLENYPLIHIAETDSTNNYLSELCDREPVAEFTTVQADFQTAGKGQRGNTWEAEKGKNLLFSFVLYPTFLEARRQFVLSQIVSLAVKEELDQWTEGISIKWPNDIYWSDKKICGMLIENDLAGMHIGRSIIGIGLNINQEQFVSDAPNPISLKQVTGCEHDRAAILDNILQRTAAYYAEVQQEGSTHIARRYLQSLFRKEGMHRYADDNGEFVAQVVDVEPDGHFILEDENRRLRRYVFKEVQYIL